MNKSVNEMAQLAWEKNIQEHKPMSNISMWIEGYIRGEGDERTKWNNDAHTIMVQDLLKIKSLEKQLEDLDRKYQNKYFILENRDKEIDILEATLKITIDTLKDIVDCTLNYDKCTCDEPVGHTCNNCIINKIANSVLFSIGAYKT